MGFDFGRRSRGQPRSRHYLESTKYVRSGTDESGETPEYHRRDGNVAAVSQRHVIRGCCDRTIDIRCRSSKCSRKHFSIGTRACHSSWCRPILLSRDEEEKKAGDSEPRRKLHDGGLHWSPEFGKIHWLRPEYGRAGLATATVDSIHDHGRRTSARVTRGVRKVTQYQ